MKKNIKSKIVVPALGLILLSTAASISGSVAWFTANRTATIKAGEFAVVNTNGNLNYTLSNGVGVTYTSATEGPIIASGSLTDSSLDIASADSNIVVPNEARDAVKKVVSLATLGTGTNNDRATNVYSAFAWDISFTLTFPTGGAQDVGLFFDAENSKAIITRTGDGVETSDGNWYTDDALTPANVVSNGTVLADGTQYYRASPRTAYVNESTPGSTGYGFRMAFIPTSAITGSSEGYGKVWSPFRANDAGGCKYVEGAVADAALTATAYTTKTVKATGGSVTAFTGLTSGKGLIDPNTTNKALPANSTVSAANALSNYENYLGFFDAPVAAGSVTLKFTCVAWYEGTDISINADATMFEKVKTSLVFGVSDLANA